MTAYWLTFLQLVNMKALFYTWNIIYQITPFHRNAIFLGPYRFSAVWTGSKSGDIWHLERSQSLDCVNNRTRSELNGQDDIKFLPNWLLLHISVALAAFLSLFQARRIMTFTLKTQCNISPRAPLGDIELLALAIVISLLLSNNSVQQWARLFLYTGCRRRDTHPRTCASTGKRRCCLSRAREKKRAAFAGTNVSAWNNQSGKEENSTPEQAEHKVNVEVLGEQTACLIVWLMRLKRRPSAEQHNSSGRKCHLENAPACLFKGQAGERKQTRCDDVNTFGTYS